MHADALTSSHTSISSSFCSVMDLRGIILGCVQQAASRGSMIMMVYGYCSVAMQPCMQCCGHAAVQPCMPWFCVQSMLSRTGGRAGHCGRAGHGCCSPMQAHTPHAVLQQPLTAAASQLPPHLAQDFSQVALLAHDQSGFGEHFVQCGPLLLRHPAPASLGSYLGFARLPNEPPHTSRG